MTNVCAICGIPIADNVRTCSYRCRDEYKNRREIVRARIRATQALKAQRRRSMDDIHTSMIRALARAVLERGVPTHPSCRDLDHDICEIDPSFEKMTPSFRKSQITRNVETIYYSPYSRAGKGRITFMLTEDKDVVRQKLEQITSQGMAA